VIPGPRPPKGHDRPAVGRDRSRALRPARPHAVGDVPSAAHQAVPHHAVPHQAVPHPADPASGADDQPLVALVRSPKGWAVVSPAGRDEVGDLVEGLSLADLVAEEFGVLPEPTAARGARPAARPTPRPRAPSRSSTRASPPSSGPSPSSSTRWPRG
jgi:hypothetical protein